MLKVFFLLSHLEVKVNWFWKWATRRQLATKKFFRIPKYRNVVPNGAIAYFIHDFKAS